MTQARVQHISCDRDLTTVSDLCCLSPLCSQVPLVGIKSPISSTLFQSFPDRDLDSIIRLTWSAVISVLCPCLCPSYCPYNDQHACPSLCDASFSPSAKALPTSASNNTCPVQLSDVGQHSSTSWWSRLHTGAIFLPSQLPPFRLCGAG